jgi:iron(III) transport system ATP-binding protein
MFQDYALFPHLTVLQNTAFGLTRLSRKNAKAEALAALDRMGLGAHIHSYPHMLSGGQQQRAALARALAPRPGVLLMDEPFSGLDAKLREEVRETALTVLKEARATAVIVTHDPEEALHLSDRVAVLRKGRLIQAAAPTELYNNPADLYVAQTLSGVTVFPCHVRQRRAVSALGVFPAPNMADGKASLCVRESAVGISPAGNGGIGGRVLDRRFLGSHVLYYVAVPGLDKALKVKICGTGTLQPGDDVSLEIGARAVMVFANQDEA